MRGAQRWQQSQSERARRGKRGAVDIVNGAPGETRSVHALYHARKHRPRALALLLKHPAFDCDLIEEGDREQVGAALDILCELDGVVETARLLGRMYESVGALVYGYDRFGFSLKLRTALFWQCVRDVPNYGSCGSGLLAWMDHRDTMLFAELARRSINDYRPSQKVRDVLKDERQALYDSISLPLELVDRVYDFMRPVVSRSITCSAHRRRERWQLPLAFGDRIEQELGYRLR
jgi:hypothetical protein